MELDQSTDRGGLRLEIDRRQGVVDLPVIGHIAVPRRAQTRSGVTSLLPTLGLRNQLPFLPVNVILILYCAVTGRNRVNIYK